jgi:hypothetical protein
LVISKALSPLYSFFKEGLQLPEIPV